MRKYITLISLVIALYYVHIHYSSDINPANENYYEYKIRELVKFNKTHLNKNKTVTVSSSVIDRVNLNRSEKVLEIIKGYDLYSNVEILIKGNKIFIGVKVKEGIKNLKYINKVVEIKKDIKKEFEEITVIIISEDLELIKTVIT